MLYFTEDIQIIRKFTPYIMIRNTDEISVTMFLIIVWKNILRSLISSLLKSHFLYRRWISTVHFLMFSRFINTIYSVAASYKDSHSRTSFAVRSSISQYTLDINPLGDCLICLLIHLSVCHYNRTL